MKRQTEWVLPSHTLKGGGGAGDEVHLVTVLWERGCSGLQVSCDNTLMSNVVCAASHEIMHV